MSIETVTVGSPNYRAGRIKSPRLIVIHTAECACENGAAVGVATFLARPSVQASCHWVTGPDLAVAQVAESDTAWAAPGANADGIQIEQTAFAGWSTEWLGGGQVPLDMLRNTAEVMAGISQRWGIPLVHLSNDELANGASGVIGHVQASEVFQQSDHWDPGPSYPYDTVIGWAREFAGGLSPASIPTPAEPSDPFDEIWSALMAVPGFDPAVFVRQHNEIWSRIAQWADPDTKIPPALADVNATGKVAARNAEAARAEAVYAHRATDAVGQAVNVISQQVVGLSTKVDAAKGGKTLAEYSDDEILAEAFRRQNKAKA